MDRFVKSIVEKEACIWFIFRSTASNVFLDFEKCLVLFLVEFPIVALEKKKGLKFASVAALLHSNIYHADRVLIHLRMIRHNARYLITV